MWGYTGEQTSGQNTPDSDPLLKRLTNSKKRDIFHTSGYAGVQSGDKIGAASAESFQRRVEIDRARNFVGRYKDSRVMRESVNALPRPESYEDKGWTNRTENEMPGRSEGTGAKTMQGRTARFEPGNLNGKMGGGSGQPPARRNPGISR